MAFNFPWTNFHELNLDWFLSKFKQFVNNYLGTTATVKLIPTTEQPEVTVTGGTLDDDTDIVDPFTFNFKLPINTSGGGAVNSVNGMVGDVVLDKTDIGLGSVDNVRQYSASNPPPYPVTSVNGMTGDVIVQGGSGNYAPAIINSTSGAMVNITDGANNLPVTSLVADIEPVQDLSNGNPSPSNICPITGHTEVNVTRTGKNLWNKDRADAQNGYYFLNGEFRADNSYRCLSFPCKEGDKFTKSGSGWGGIVTFWNGSSFVSGVNNTTVTVPSGVNIAKFACQYSSANAQLETGSTATAYEPYQGTTLTIDWTTVAGTVYGGTLDVTTGVLTVDMANIASYNGETLPGAWISDRDVYAQGTTPTTGAQVVYELDTPQTYQLTPQQVLTLLGVNHIWCNTGDTTVVYTADTKEYIQNLTQPSEDDMVANTTIASGKFFMIGNNLYRASTAISSGSQIIPGTNATPLSLADALNLL